MIGRALWRLLLEQGGWSRIWYGLATAMVIAGGGLIYNQTQDGGAPPPPAVEGCPLPAYPDASCTGVPDGTSLTVVNGDYDANTNNQVIDGLDVRGHIYVTATGVTIENSKMYGISMIGNSLNTASPRLTVQDSEINCHTDTINDNRKGIKAGEGIAQEHARNLNVYRVDLQNCEDGLFVADNYTVLDSYFHDPWDGGGQPHNDGMQIFGDYDGSNIVIDHNYIYWNDTSALQFCNSADSGVCPNTFSDVLVSNNEFGGSGWTVYCPQRTSTNFVLVDNKWFNNSWFFGPGTNCDGEYQLGNRIVETGSIVNLDGTPATDCSGFPDASCTGVPPGTSLDTIGAQTINTAGTVLNGKNITGAVTVNAPNVVIANSRITARAFANVQTNSTNFRMINVEVMNEDVSGQNRCHNAVQESNMVLDRVELTGCENGINILAPGNIRMFNSWIHDLDTVGPSYQWGNDPHTDGIQFDCCTSNIYFAHNTIDPVGTVTGVGATSAVIMYAGSSQTPNSDVTFDDNYLDGREAAYALYAPRVQTTGININNNKMYSGGVGYTDCVRVGVTVAEFNNNRDAGTNALISADEGAGQACED